MGKRRFILNLFLLLSGLGCGISVILGYLRIIDNFSSVVGSVLFLAGFIAIYYDKQEEFYGLEDRIYTTSLIKIKISFPDIIKKLSIGQTFLICVSLMIYFFILVVMFLQGIYQLDVFSSNDLRFASWLVSLIIFGYAIMYTIGEILGLRFSKEQKSKKKNKHP